MAKIKRTLNGERNPLMHSLNDQVFILKKRSCNRLVLPDLIVLPDYYTQLAWILSQ